MNSRDPHSVLCMSPKGKREGEKKEKREGAARSSNCAAAASMEKKEGEKRIGKEKGVKRNRAQKREKKGEG